MKSSFLLILVFLVLGVPTMACQTPAVTPSTDGLSCSRFEWSADQNGPKAVMRVPISIAGKQYSYQLDTGADVVIAYGPGERKDWVKKADFNLVKHVIFGGMTLASAPIARMLDISDKDVQGSVGLDLLVGHTFVIDFPKMRICLLDRADLPDSLGQAASWVPAEIRNGKLFLKNITLNGQNINVIYDSGTSPDELVVDFPAWMKATGKQGAQEATKHQYAQTWGKKIEYVSANSTGSLLIGKKSYQNPNLTTCPSQPASFHDNVFGADGALGNALFLNSILILDLGSHPYFGVVSLTAKP